MKTSRWDPALLGIIGPTSFIASWVIAGQLRDGYDVSNDTISRLAELGAPDRWIVLTGITIVSFASILMGVLVGRRWGAKVASVVMVIAGTSAFGLGFFPCSAGCPGIEGEFTDTMHSVMAAIHYIAFGLSPLVLAINSRQTTPKGFRAFSIFATVFGGFFLLSQFTGWGPNGITQRIGLTTLDLWMMATAMLLLRAQPMTTRLFQQEKPLYRENPRFL